MKGVLHSGDFTNFFLENLVKLIGLIFSLVIS